MLLLIPLGLILLGLAIRMSLALVYGVRGPDEHDLLHLGGRIASWIFIGLGLSVWMLIPLIGSIGAVAICIMLWILALFAIVETVQSTREASRRNNATLLAITLREGQMQQAAMLLSSMNSGYFVNGPAKRLAHELHNGTPLYESIALSKGALPRDAGSYAAIGTLAHAEAAALEELSRPADVSYSSALRLWVDSLAYMVGLLATMGIFMLLYTTFIVPQFREIFEEFDLELPPATELVFGLVGQTWLWAFVALGIVALLLGGFITAIFYLFDVPIFRFATDWWLGSVRKAEIFRQLALAFEHRAELPRALYALSVTTPVPAFRNRLRAAYDSVAAGQPWTTALVNQGMLTPDEQALVNTAEGVGNVPWALRQLAKRRESHLATRLLATSNVVYPLIILFMGLIVGMVVIALFVPLVKLIEGLT